MYEFRPILFTYLRYILIFYGELWYKFCTLCPDRWFGDLKLVISVVSRVVILSCVFVFAVWQQFHYAEFPYCNARYTNTETVVLLSILAEVPAVVLVVTFWIILFLVSDDFIGNICFFFFLYINWSIQYFVKLFRRRFIIQYFVIKSDF